MTRSSADHLNRTIIPIALMSLSAWSHGMTPDCAILSGDTSAIDGVNLTYWVIGNNGSGSGFISSKCDEDLGTKPRSEIYLGLFKGSSGSLDVDGSLTTDYLYVAYDGFGTMQVRGPLNTPIEAWVGHGSFNQQSLQEIEGLVTLDGADAHWITGDLTIARANNMGKSISRKVRGVVNLNDGAQLDCLGPLVVGKESASQGTLSATGDSVIVLNERSVIGGRGEGNLSLDSSTLIARDDLIFGQTEGSVTECTLDHDSKLIAGRDLEIGRSGLAEFIVTGGSYVSVQRDLEIGVANAQARGLMTVSGSDIKCSSLELGNGNTGAIGEMVIESGSRVVVNENLLIQSIDDLDRLSMIRVHREADFSVYRDTSIGLFIEGLPIRIGKIEIAGRATFGTSELDSFALIGRSTLSLKEHADTLIAGTLEAISSDSLIRFQLSASHSPKLRVSGDVNLGASLHIGIDVPTELSLGDTITLLEIDGTLNGRFHEYPEGSEIWSEGTILIQISYEGGDGNDIVLTVESRCPADLTGDGALDFFDVSAFLTAFGNQDPAADFTGDSSFDFFDVSAFLTAFGMGCP